MTRLTQLVTHSRLLTHREQLSSDRMDAYFRRDAERARKLSASLGDLLFDYSKHRVTEETMSLLCELAREAGVEAARERMFSGEKINVTEGRAVLHVALRNRSDRAISVDGKDVMPGVRAVLDKLRAFSERVRSGSWTGHTGKPIRDIVNVGIGGSDLGPAMVSQALAPFLADTPRLHYVSNVDGAHVGETLKHLDPETTLVCVVSKTFTTQETMRNAATARRWLVGHLKDDTAVAKHFVAVSTNAEAVAEFGIDVANMFGFWDWVGGRYSLWSAVGLSLACGLGFDRFAELLEGAYDVDEHFRTAPLERNVPVLMALLGIWYENYLDVPTHAVIPYSQSLARLPAYLQQLDMESNGKSVDVDGQPITDYRTGPVVWGEPGTGAQHAFFQLVHQGRHVVPMDLIIAAKSQYPGDEHQLMLLSNCLAQAEALMAGKSESVVRDELRAAGMDPERIERLAPHKRFAGNRPTSVLLFDELSPHALGRLLALQPGRTFMLPMESAPPYLPSEPLPLLYM